MSAQPSPRPASIATADNDNQAAGAHRRPLAPCPWEAPRPKPDPLTEPPAAGWEGARRIQINRQRLRTRAKSQPDGAVDKSWGLAKMIDRKAREEARQSDPLEGAVLSLRRRGRIVYCMSVIGGQKGLYFVSGLGPDQSPSDIVNAAAKVL